MIDYSKYKTSQASPEASSMIENLRAIGYSTETAIADIIDNSISALSKNIWIDYEWKGPETIISIMDDGFGMNSKEIIDAMRPGSKNPNAIRELSDLGRFGLGLKTASFSQCRKFSVISKREKEYPSFWCWDIDYVNIVKDWSLLEFCPDDHFLTKISGLNSGTIVIWWELDRITKDTSTDSEESIDKFLTIMENVKKHIAMVFHRFISEGLNIYFRDKRIEGWDPFMIGYEGLQTKPEVKLNSGKVSIKGYILPHRSKLSEKEYNYGKGPKDSWTAHQGFYVYRNKRMLVAGDWLGYFKKEVHYDLCRISIDLPNNNDSDWQIDIKKSVARPPLKFKEQINAVAKDVRVQALEVYRFKGKVIRKRHSSEEYYPVWQEMIRHGKRFYKINRDHPIVKSCLDIDNGEKKHDVELLLQFIEETIPVPIITLNENQNEIPHIQPFEGTSHNPVKETMNKMYDNLIINGKTPQEATAIILNIEPFNLYPEYITLQ